MYDLVVKALLILNSFLTAGIAITAFSLLLYALSFNLRDHVARSFAVILLCVVTVFVGEALSSVTTQPKQLDFWLRLQWVGIIFLPATYAHLSDSLLSTTGKPSRGRRRFLVRVMYFFSLVFLLALPTGLLVGPLVQARPAPHLERTWLTWIFSGYYMAAMLFSWNNFLRAHQRTVTSTSRRRMAYLLMGALAPALGSYPYLLFGSGIAAQHPLIFWLTVTLSNMMVTVLLVLMAYAVAFFGVPWPDRVVKRRLFKWLMRGPVTASTVLVVTTIVRRTGNKLGIDLSAVVPVIMVSLILVLEHLITLISPTWERRLFFGKDRADMELLQTLDERLLTLGDLQQFLESILAAVCDRLQSPKAFIATLSKQGIESMITIGGENPLEEELPDMLLRAIAQNGIHREIFTWGDYWLVPLFNRDTEIHDMIGLLGARRQGTAIRQGTADRQSTADLQGTDGNYNTVEPKIAIEQPLTAKRRSDTEKKHKQTPKIPEQEQRSQEYVPDGEQREALAILAERAALAISDRNIQQQAFSSLEELTPRLDMFQRLRAAARYDGTEILTTSDFSLQQDDLSPMIKDALTHYWGGPKLTQSPLLNLRIVQQTARESEENTINALRTILRRAIENVRPEGERRFTAEWILYNILEMKFMEGRKVREIAMRLAMSEADLYRKQRVAIEAVAKTILEMEQQVRQDLTVAVETTSQINNH